MVVDLQELPLYVAQSNVISSLSVKIQLDLEKWWLNQDRTFSFYSIDFGSKWSRAGFALYHKFLMTLVSLNIHPEVWSCVTFSHPILENRKEAMMGGRQMIQANCHWDFQRGSHRTIAHTGTLLARV